VEPRRYNHLSVASGPVPDVCVRACPDVYVLQRISAFFPPASWPLAPRTPENPAKRWILTSYSRVARVASCLKNESRTHSLVRGLPCETDYSMLSYINPGVSTEYPADVLCEPFQQHVSRLRQK